ncbi:alpha-L-fucosidase [Xylanimonas ulmi]|uniref:alpha-L-fucosidase n=1 Tax=Xylanimonas ulmi TaxID=228973 RepID=A0A4Q7M740_9MICO|nr:alpha-L-fucosidase [Xylanibacterium ulmi]RZS61919.1 alpha-L-fucosidase [Xylanibacterium ulmi]
MTSPTPPGTVVIGPAATGPAGPADRTAWFRHDHYGMFVHYGSYAVGGRQEWVKYAERMDDAAYRRYAEHFDPDLYDARAVARLAKEAGQRYVVLTAKHHEGFCLWDTATTDYCVARTRGRDLVREHVEALRAQGLRVGVYFSLLDWSHPHYTVDWSHPLRDAPDVAALNATRDMGVFRQYMREQLRELLTGYGPIDYLFVDFTQPGVRHGLPGKSADDWDSPGLLAMCRELQPQMVVNDRFGLPADLVTPEQYQPVRPIEVDGERVLWEACQTINGAWGYDRDNLDDKSPELIARMLAETVSLGGNLLLNVGPTARGEVLDRHADILRSVGRWLRRHGDAIYGAGPADVAPPSGVIYTQRGDKLYAHVLAWPFKTLYLPGLGGRVGFARLLWDGSQVEVDAVPERPEGSNLNPAAPPPGTLTLTLPVRRPDELVPVIELTLTDGPR